MTSALPREGKTATAVNLAVVLSQLGKKVLLVDADLHKSRLHEIFLISNRTGLVSILAESVPAESAIAKTAIPDLFVLPSGPASPNPSGLLSSEAMSVFLDRARRAYDHVIIDTPPILPVADAMLLANLTDGAILCVKAGADSPRPGRSRSRSNDSRRDSAPGCAPQRCDRGRRQIRRGQPVRVRRGGRFTSQAQGAAGSAASISRPA